MRLYFASLLSVALVTTCAQPGPPPILEPAPVSEAGHSQAIDDVRILSSDEMAGRKVGEAGNAAARGYIVSRLSELGIAPLTSDYLQPFTAVYEADTDNGTGALEAEAFNILGVIPGASKNKSIVVTAHYDHLGVINGEIYNGADDNASGVAGLLAIAEHFVSNRPDHTIVLAAVDAEEGGIKGSRFLVESGLIPHDNIIANLNLDMISQDVDGTLFVAGTYHTPALLPMIEDLAQRAPLILKTGHDQPDNAAGDDWTLASDHGPFHEIGVPFIYLGVEDHEHYHQPTDTFANLTQDFFLRSVVTSVMIAEALDDQADELLE